MTSRVLLTAALLLGCVGPALAQNARPENTEVPKVLLENEQVRVLEVRFKAGAKIEALSQPNRFIYALTDGALLFSPPGKTPYELSFKIGEALWLPGQAMASQNDTDKEVRAVVVELKDMSGLRGRRAVSAKTAGRAKKPPK